jgi:hypothetical protein
MPKTHLRREVFDGSGVLEALLGELVERLFRNIKNKNGRIPITKIQNIITIANM